MGNQTDDARAPARRPGRSAPGVFLLEKRSERPLVPLALFRGPVFSAALAAAATMTFGMYAMLFLVPLYVSYAGQDTAADVHRTIAGMRAAFVAGGCGELLGAIIALRFIPGDALAPAG